MAAIKTLELDPTRENIYNTLVADAVGRNKHLWRFAGFCSVQERRCSIALDSAWGTGKTFFLKQLEMLFDAYRDQPKQLNADKQKAIRDHFETFANDDELGMAIQPHFCVYYDAWLNDNANDPLLSILHELIKQTGFKKKEKIDYWKTASSLVDAITGRNTSGLVNLAQETNPVLDIKDQKSFYDFFADYLDQLVPKNNGRLLVLIDELDRCKPTYAVQLLERIKHYLSNDRITFVFAVNEEQLLNTIKVFYGEEFDAYQYLDRFFDYRLSLPKPDMEVFNKYYGFDQSNEQTSLYRGVCDAFVQEYSLSLRETTKYRNWVEIVCGAFLKQQPEANDKSWKVVICIIIPVMLGLKLKDKTLFSAFISGHIPEQIVNPLHAVVNRCHVANDFLTHLKPPRLEKINGSSQWTDKQNPVNCIGNIYKYLFTSHFLWEKSASDCGFIFKNKMRETISLAPSFMDDFIKFDTNTEETAHG